MEPITTGLAILQTGAGIYNAFTEEEKRKKAEQAVLNSIYGRTLPKVSEEVTQGLAEARANQYAPSATYKTGQQMLARSFADAAARAGRSGGPGALGAVSSLQSAMSDGIVKLNAQEAEGQAERNAAVQRMQLAKVQQEAVVQAAKQQQAEDLQSLALGKMGAANAGKSQSLALIAGGLTGLARTMRKGSAPTISAATNSAPLTTATQDGYGRMVSTPSDSDMPMDALPMLGTGPLPTFGQDYTQVSALSANTPLTPEDKYKAYLATLGVRLR